MKQRAAAMAACLALVLGGCTTTRAVWRLQAVSTRALQPRMSIVRSRVSGSSRWSCTADRLRKATEDALASAPGADALVDATATERCPGCVELTAMALKIER